MAYVYPHRPMNGLAPTRLPPVTAPSLALANALAGITSVGLPSLANYNAPVTRELCITLPKCVWSELDAGKRVSVELRQKPPSGLGCV